MALIDDIRTKFARGQVEFSRHATDQSILRHIRVGDIRDAMTSPTAEIIEDYPDDKYGPSCLVLGFTPDRRPIHVQCSYPWRQVLKVITVYEPSSGDWLDFRVRRKP
jgi:hypothetical protein